MQTSGLPTRIAVPFADAGTKNTIPVASQIGITGGAASFTTGFPPLTMTPVSAGGIPPFGADFNGILNAITNAIRWNVAGSGYPFDSTFATAVTGYPKGALLPASDFSGYWLNTQEANTTAPENSTSATTGWVPGVHYGATALTGLSSSSVTLTTLQAAKPRITLAGMLTANINLVFPAWVRSWTVVNNCTGNFSVTCKTPAGTGVTIPAGLTAVINGDGTNITQDTNILGAPGRLLNKRIFTAAGTYTPTLGTNEIIVEAVGGGASGGNCATTSGTTFGSAGGGASGSYVKASFTSGFSSVAIVIGAGGVASAAGSTAGLAGGNTTFGSLITAPGGNAGTAGVVGTTQAIIPGTFNSTAATVTGGTVITSLPGMAGGYGLSLNTTAAAGGSGGSNPLGTGAWSGVSGGSRAASGYGAGSSGASSTINTTATPGQPGTPGVVIIYEYS